MTTAQNVPSPDTLSMNEGQTKVWVLLLNMKRLFHRCARRVLGKSCIDWFIIGRTVSANKRHMRVKSHFLTGFGPAALPLRRIRKHYFRGSLSEELVSYPERRRNQSFQTISRFVSSHSAKFLESLRDGGLSRILWRSADRVKRAL